MSQASPGWFAQPDGTQRYWDGTDWTAHTAPGYPTYQPPYPGGLAVAPKNPAISLLISFFIPGVGSMVNGDTSIGVAILIGYVVSIPFVLLIIGFPMMIGFWIWGMVDAYQGAERWNRAHGIVS